MGSRDPQTQLWSYRVNLDKRVRSDHPKLNEVFPSWYPTSGTTKQLCAQTLQEWAMGKWRREADADAQPLGSKFRRLFSRLISAESTTLPGELRGYAAAASKSNVTTGFVLPRSV
jgi:hypothetical protein